jgi:putative oxidoreductase
MDVIVPLGRLLFTAIFITSGISHFTQRKGMVPYARSQGVPAPNLMIPLTGVMLLIGGLSVLVGYWARVGALLLVIFLIPTALIMHRFWGLPEHGKAQQEKAHFMKDIALAGAALMIVYFGPGPYSLRPE